MSRALSKRRVTYKFLYDISYNLRFWVYFSPNLFRAGHDTFTIALEFLEFSEIFPHISEPVCVVSIVGPYRQGKSYILSEVFGGKNIFSIGHYLDPETFGLWMWIVPEVFQV